MSEAFLSLSDSDRKEALNFAAGETGRPANLLEKDVWVVWTLNTLFNSPFGQHLVFKGGTSLSKAYGVISRFSEDIDLTYDIRELIPDLAKGKANPMPPTRSQAGKWIDAVRKSLPGWIETEVVSLLQDQLKAHGLEAVLTQSADKLELEYQPLVSGSGYVKPIVLMEFGARSSGEPAELRDVVCDAATVLHQLQFPTARPRVMNPERTFWEKATAAHVFCKQDGSGAARFARHWYDLARLHSAGIATTAIANIALAREVAEHKQWFFRETTSEGAIDLVAAVNGGLQLVPSDAAFSGLEADYAAMSAEGLFFHTPEPFAQLMEQCGVIEREANIER